MFRIPTITKNLLIINGLIYLFSLILENSNINLDKYGGLYFFLSENFHIYQFITYQFLHSTDSFMHILGNMFGLWMFGSVIENVWGQRKFLFYYISCGIGAGLCQEFAQYATCTLFPNYLIEAQTSINGTIQVLKVPFIQYIMQIPTIGASGAIYGIILAFGMSFPNERIFIIPIPFPIKAKWFVMGYAVVELYLSIVSSGDGVAHTAHLGGMLFGFLMIRYWNKHPNARFDKSRGQQFFENLKRNFDQRQQNQHHNPNMHAERGGSKEADMEYNARKKANQDEIDAILDKIRKSGYDSLSKEEKQKLFDASNR